MPRKRQRLQTIGNELDETIHNQIQEDILISKSDEDLFTIDNSGSKTAKAKVVNEAKQKQKLSRGEQKHISKALSKKSLKVEELLKASLTPKVYDIWNESPVESSQLPPTITEAPRASLRNLNNKKRSLVSMIKPGMSYNPAQSHHQAVLAEAVSIEQKKIEKDETSKIRHSDSLAIVSSSINNKNRILTVGDEFYNANQSNIDDADDSEDDEDSDEDDDEDITSMGEDGEKKLSKLKSKLTTAERNKKRDLKDRLFKEAKEKRNTDVLKSLSLLPTIVKTIRKDANIKSQLKAQKDKEMALKKRQQELLALTTMSYEEAGQVPLSDELNGSLRQLVPKGNRVKDMLSWKVKSGEAMAKDRRKRRAYEKPHGRSNVKWVAGVK